MKFKNYIDPCKLYEQLDVSRQDFYNDLSEFCDNLSQNSQNKLYNLLSISLPNALLQQGKRHIFEALEQHIDANHLSQELKQRYFELKKQWIELWIPLKSTIEDLSIYNKWSLSEFLTSNPKYIKTKILYGPVSDDNDRGHVWIISGEKVPHYRKVVAKLSKAGSVPVNDMKGSHQLWENQNHEQFIVTKPHKGEKRMKLGTLKSMLHKAGIAEEDFYAL